MGPQHIRTRLFPQEHNAFLQSDGKRQICLRLSALPLRPAFGCLYDVCRQPLPATRILRLGRQRTGYVQVVGASLSVDCQYNTLDADLAEFVYPRRSTLLAALATSFSWDKFRLQGSLLYTHVSDRTSPWGCLGREKNEYTPSAVMQYKPFGEHDLSIRAFYKRIFRMPTLNDLYYTFAGNKYLKPEYTTQYDAGIVYARDFSAVRSGG